MSKLAPTAHQLSKKFIGYGHYELTISSSEGQKRLSQKYGLDRTAKLRDDKEKRGSDCRSNRSSS